jgi:hypothetical protein
MPCPQNSMPVDEARLAADFQELDASTPIRDFDVIRLLTLPSHTSKAKWHDYYLHTEALLSIVKAVLPEDRADVVARCWTAYCAGFRRSRCITCNITQLEYWYAVGCSHRDHVDHTPFIPKDDAPCATRTSRR